MIFNHNLSQSGTITFHVVHLKIMPHYMVQVFGVNYVFLALLKGVYLTFPSHNKNTATK